MIHFSSEELASKFYFTQAPAIASPGSKVSSPITCHAPAQGVQGILSHVFLKLETFSPITRRLVANTENTICVVTAIAACKERKFLKKILK